MTAKAYGNLEQAWRRVLVEILDNGIESSPRGMKTKELLHTSFTLRDANRNIVWNPVRKINPVFSVAEWLWMLLGREDVRSIAHFNKNIAAFSDDGLTFWGAYGPRIASQLDHVIGSLKRDPDTRQAVMTTWRPSPPATKDVPCTVAWQFLLRDGRLHAQVFMRSNDAWLGLPYDVFNFTRIQAYVAASIGAPTGAYTHTVGSLHLYETNWDAAEAALAAPPFTHPEPVSPPLNAIDRAGHLAVLFDHLSDPKVVAPHWTEIDALAEPWQTYFGLLLYKTTKDRSLLRPPYDSLIEEKAQAAA